MDKEMCNAASREEWRGLYKVTVYGKIFTYNVTNGAVELNREVSQDISFVRGTVIQIKKYLLGWIDNYENKSLIIKPSCEKCCSSEDGVTVSFMQGRLHPYGMDDGTDAETIDLEVKAVEIPLGVDPECIKEL